MGIKRHKPEEIVTKLRQVEVLCGQGMPRIDAIRQGQVTEQTFYRWRKQYGGMHCPAGLLQMPCPPSRLTGKSNQDEARTGKHSDPENDIGLRIESFSPFTRRQ